LEEREKNMISSPFGVYLEKAMVCGGLTQRRSGLAFIQDPTVGTFSCCRLRVSKSGKHRKASGAI